MKLLNKLERRFGRYAVHNLMKYIIGLYGIGLVIGTLSPYMYNMYFSLDFNMILKGQVWRLVTFIIPPISLSGILLTAITVYVYYLIGNSLERTWGAFKLNMYFLSGILINLLASLVIYLITKQSIYVTIDVVCGTLFFAFAAIYPNTQFLLYFLIPIKAKYLAWFQGAMYIYQIVTCLVDRQYLSIFAIVASLGNFLIFFFATRNYRKISPNEINRKAKFHRQMNHARQQGPVSQYNGQNVITRHKCAVCGRTELDDDQLEFRFCSKCDGNYEYCMDHLFSHEHVKR